MFFFEALFRISNFNSYKHNSLFTKYDHFYNLSTLKSESAGISGRPTHFDQPTWHRLLQGEHKVFPCYKHLLQDNYVEYKQTPQLAEFQPWITFQQDGATPHRGSDVRRFWDAAFPSR